MSKRANKDQETAKAMAKAGRVFRERREALRISFEKAATVSGLSPGTIRRIELGDSGVSIGVLVSYLNALGAGSLFLEALSGVMKAAARSPGEEAFAAGIAEIRQKMLSERM